MTLYELGPSLRDPTTPTFSSAGRTKYTEELPVQPKTVNSTAASTLSSRHEGRFCAVHAQNLPKAVLVELMLS